MLLDDNVTLLNIANTTNEVATKIDNNFLPHNTVITVNADGSGDFPTLQAAINWLTDKSCNGTLLIQLSDGEFNVDNCIDISGDNNNVRYLCISGNGSNKTKLVTNMQSDISDRLINVSNGSTVEINNLEIKHLSGGRNKGYSRGVGSTWNSTVILNNVSITGFDEGINTFANACVEFKGTVSISNCVVGVSADNTATVCSGWGPTINIDNVETVFRANKASRISFFGATINKANYGTLSNASSSSVIDL